MCLELGRGLLTLVVVVAILVAWGECGSNGGATEAAEYGGNVSPAAGTGALDDVGAVGLVGFRDAVLAEMAEMAEMGWSSGRGRKKV